MCGSVLIIEYLSGLLQPVPEGDYEALVTVMGYLMNVKDRAVTTDDMFQPLTETIELLKFYDMDIPEEVNVLLQVRTNCSHLEKISYEFNERKSANKYTSSKPNIK